MSKTAKQRTPAARGLAKSPTGIQGLDEITGGGLPRGRPTLVCGSAGCGKTLLAMEFLVRGATQFGEPGVFMSFEETAPELTQNVRSLGFDLDELAKQKKLAVDFVRVERNEIEETGCSSASTTRSTPSARSGSCWTPLKRSLAVCPTPPSCAANCVACSAG